MLTKPFKPLALAFLVNLIISVEDKIKYIFFNFFLGDRGDDASSNCFLKCTSDKLYFLHSDGHHSKILYFCKNNVFETHELMDKN